MAKKVKQEVKVIPMVPNKIWSPAECASLFNITPYTLRTWVAAGKIDCISDIDSRGRRYNVRFLAEHINARLMAMGHNPAA